MAMTRVCDLCGKPAEDMCYQYAVPSVLVDNKGLESADSSYTDVCPTCVTQRAAEVLALITAKATGK